MCYCFLLFWINKTYQHFQNTTPFVVLRIYICLTKKQTTQNSYKTEKPK